MRKKYISYNRTERLLYLEVREMLMPKYSFAVEEKIQKRFDEWLKNNGIWYENTIMYEVPGARFRIYTVYYAFMNREAVVSWVNNKLKELRHG